MNKFAFVTALSLITTPLAAQDADMSEGLDLLGQGMELLLEGLMDEIGPALKELGPALKSLEGKIIDLNAYHAPEVLPNGDIIIRRKTPLEPLEDGEVDI